MFLPRKQVPEVWFYVFLSFRQLVGDVNRAASVGTLANGTTAVQNQHPVRIAPTPAPVQNFVRCLPNLSTICARAIRF